MLNKFLNNLFLIFISIFLSFSTKMFGLTFIKGNAKNSTFDFNIGATAYNPKWSLYFTSCNKDIEKNSYALAYAGIPGTRVPGSKDINFGDKFFPLAPEKVTLNGEQDQDNPLFGAKIRLLNLIGNNLAVVKEDEPNVIYFLDISRGPLDIRIFTLNYLKNLEVFSLGTSATGSDNVNQENLLFAAISDKESLDKNKFSLAVLTRGFVKEKIKDEETQEEKEKTSLAGLVQVASAVEIYKDSPFLKINSSVSYIKKDLDFEWMLFKSPLDLRIVEALYVAFKLKSGDDKASGAKAVAIGGFSNDKNKQLNLISIAPDSAFNDQGQIVGGTNNKTFNISKVKSIITSTHLPYLIVVKDKNKVFSLPIVNDTSLKGGFGQLANVNANPVDKFSGSGRFIARTFSQPAISPQDLYTENSVQAKVGGAVKLYGTINEIQASNDTVYVSVNSKNKNKKSGIFYSRALLEANGKIKQWTDWKRASSIDQDIKNFAIDLESSNVWSICANDKKTVNKTFWSNGSTNIEKSISQFFPKEKGGVFSVFALPYKTIENKTIDNTESLVLATGINKVAFLELSSYDSVLKSDNISDLITFDNLNIGSIISAEIISSNNYNYLLVAGSKGLSILSDPSGRGWPIGEVPTKNLIKSMNFKKISDLNNIIKLSSVDNNLFVLTPRELNNFIFNQDKIVSKKTIAKPQLRAISRVKSYFTGLIATPKALFIGSTSGLIIYDFNKFKYLNLPEGVGSETGIATPVSKLYAYTSTGFDKDLINNGNLYVINGYKAWQRSQIYRFQVNNSNLIPIKDLYVKDCSTLFIDLGSYYNSYWCDGAQTYLTKSKTNRLTFDHSGNRYQRDQLKPMVYMFRPEIKSSQREVFYKAKSPTLNIDDYNTIGSIVKSCSGKTIVCGDFGIRFNS